MVFPELCLNNMKHLKILRINKSFLILADLPVNTTFLLPIYINIPTT